TRPDRRAHELGGCPGGIRSGTPARRRRSGRGRRVRRSGRPVRRRPRIRGSPHHMNRKARQELIGIGALAVGLFLGLTLLRLPITGSWGDQIGSRLWRVLGVGTRVGLFALAALGIRTVGWHPLVALRTGSRERGAGPAVTPKTPKKENDAAPRERKEPLPAPRSLAEKTRKAKSVPPPKPPP